MRLGGGGVRLGFGFLSCFLGGFGTVGIQELAGHGRRVRGWIEAWGKRRVASSSSVIGSGFVGSREEAWRRVGIVTGMDAISPGLDFGSWFGCSFRILLMARRRSPGFPASSGGATAAPPPLLPR